MKKITGILTALCVVILSACVMAQNDISITVNGVLLDFDQPPIIENDRTLVPMRAIFEALGCKVDYWDEEKTVFAEKGFNAVSLVIGKSTMLLNGETEIALDVPAKIVNSRTLIPLRAVSEALGANVEWNGQDRAVIIESKQGAHKIERKVLTEKIDGKVDFEANVYYPFIASDGNDFIDAINESYENDAKTTIKEELDFYNECIKDEYFPDEYELTFTLDMDYNVTMDRNGYLSIVTTYATYTGGAHPNSTMIGRTFDLRRNKELSLREVFNAETFDLERAVAERIADKVSEYSDDEEHVQSVYDAAIQDIDNAGFYLTDNMVHVFYVPYQIASYAEGYLTADIYYDSEYINVDLSDYDWPELVYEIPGNRTTGFEWTLVQDSDKLDIELYYIEPEISLPGAGGVYKMRVKGVKPGNAEVRLEYKRGFEELPIETLEYSFYVENDLGVTLINENQVQ